MIDVTQLQGEQTPTTVAPTRNSTWPDIDHPLVNGPSWRTTVSTADDYHANYSRITAISAASAGLHRNASCGEGFRFVYGVSADRSEALPMVGIGGRVSIFFQGNQSQQLPQVSSSLEEVFLSVDPLLCCVFPCRTVPSVLVTPLVFAMPCAISPVMRMLLPLKRAQDKCLGCLLGTPLPHLPSLAVANTQSVL